MAAVRVSSPVRLPPFQELIDAHGRDVHRLLIALVGRDESDDCYQDTWIAALRAYPQLRDATNLRSWVLTIAHRKALDQLRARKRVPALVGEVPDHAAAPAAEPADSALWRHVRDLPDKQRTAVALRYVVDASYTEISTLMQTSEDAARRSVHEGLKRLRMEYQP
jgi:RNA polymerase sigma factor (sigma-70 family)